MLDPLRGWEIDEEFITPRPLRPIQKTQPSEKQIQVVRIRRVLPSVHEPRSMNNKKDMQTSMKPLISYSRLKLQSHYIKPKYTPNQLQSMQHLKRKNIYLQSILKKLSVHDEKYERPIEMILDFQSPVCSELKPFPKRISPSRSTHFQSRRNFLL
ncbi:hypothetical protein pb186bvf_011713 [Paramecium bursaria]